jgi:hypothetical protein
VGSRDRRWQKNIYRSIHPDGSEFWKAHRESTVANTALTLMSPVAGKHLHVQTLIINNRQAGALRVSFYDGSSTASNELLSVTIPATNTGVVVPMGGNGFPLSSEDRALIYSAEDAGAIEITAFGIYGTHEE